MKKYNSNFYIVYTLCIILVSFALLVSCSNEKKEPYDITTEERVWLSKFFTDVMFFEHGIYTLWGSKSITLIIINHRTEEEIRAYMDSLSDEDKKDCCYYDFSLPTNWPKWEAISQRFPLNRFLFFKTNLFQDSNATFILLVDPLKTATVLKDHYDDFKKVFGADFHPLEVALDIQNDQSEYWNKIKGHANLWGILFGFGKFNASIFEWKHFDHPNQISDYCQNIKGNSSNPQLTGHVKYDAQHFELPSFISFNEPDEMIEKYQLERKKIQEIYKGHDFLDLTLQKLTE